MTDGLWIGISRLHSVIQIWLLTHVGLLWAQRYAPSKERALESPLQSPISVEMVKPRVQIENEAPATEDGQKATDDDNEADSPKAKVRLQR